MLTAVVLGVAVIVPGGQGPPRPLPSEIQASIRKQYEAPGMETRYVAAAIDLNGDAKPEIVVHVIGGLACGSGGCPTLVFTPEGSGYRLVSTITVTNPPIRASSATTRGWRNLIVHVSGGGAKPHDAELMFDGKGYPGNPTVPGSRVKGAGAGGQVLIKEATFDSANCLAPKPAAPKPAAAAPPCTVPAPGRGTRGRTSSSGAHGR